MPHVLHPEYDITDVSAGGKNNRRLLPLSKLSEWETSPERSQIDCHISMYRFQRDIMQYARENNNSTSGYRGPYFADFFLVDIDHDSLQESTHTAKQVVMTLMDKYQFPEEAIGIFYSGNRGYHIMVRLQNFGDFEPDEDFASILHELALVIFDGSGYIDEKGDTFTSDYIDLKVYSPQHMIRYPNSMHEKTRRFKIPISLEDLGDLPGIVEQSIQKRPYAKLPVVQTQYSLEDGEEVRRRKKSGEIRTRTSRTLASEAFKSTLSADLKENSAIGASRSAARHRSYCEMMRGHMRDKEVRGQAHGRREALLRLLGYFLNKGIPEDIAHEIMLRWNESNIDPLDEKVFYTTFRYVYKRR